MRLQVRLLLTIALAAIPLVSSLLWFERKTRYSVIESQVSATVLEAMRGDQLALCERSPGTFKPELSFSMTGRRRGGGRQSVGARFDGAESGGSLPVGAHGMGQLRIYPYDSEFRSARPDAPPLEPELVAEVRDGHPLASRPITLDARDGFEVLLQVPGGHQCSYVLARRPIPVMLTSSPFQLRTAMAWLLPSLGTLIAVYFGIGLLVRRVTRLTREVRSSSLAGYAELPADSGRDEIAELRQAFVGAGRAIVGHIDALETKERALREFLSNTTHDVLLPLTVLQGHLSTLIEEQKTTLGAPTEALTAAVRESHYIGSLLRNLALSARLEGRNPVELTHAVDLGELVARAVARHQFVARQQSVELNHSVPERPLVVLGDPVAIEQAVSNVIYNAIAHNRAGGHVAVLLEHEDADRFALRILDDGPGVSEEERIRLVERHYQGEAARSRHQGSGLGLNIALRVSELHQWLMQLRRLEPTGLEVRFAGPVQMTPSPGPGAVDRD